MASSAYLYCTNCLLADTEYLQDKIRTRAYNCIITNSAAMQVDAKYRPKLGSFLGIDAGETAYSSGALAGTVAVDGLYSFTFAISGGTLEAFLGGVSAGVYSEAGEQTVTLKIPDTKTEFRFVFTPDEETPGAAVLKKISSNKGFVITYR